METAPVAARLPALDLIRGVAVLGILAVNVTGLAGPVASVFSPHLPVPGTTVDEAVFAAMLILFEGKMRGLFTLLFGASLLLLVERAEAAGRDGQHLQLRRLGCLALIGYLHFVLFWWGDILFAYGVIGIIALALRHLSSRVMIAAALILFSGWHLSAASAGLPAVAREAAVLAGTATAAQEAEYRAERAAATAETARELAGYRQGFAAQARDKLTGRTAEPLAGALAILGETLPLMLLGMVLLRSGFFQGRWPRRRLLALALGGAAAGGALTLAIAGQAWAQGFPPVFMRQALAGWLAPAHLLMTLSYAAALALAAPRLLNTAMGRRLEAAGTMALTNYLAMTVLLSALFQGWGLALMAQVPERTLVLLVIAGWALMLTWSQPWLARFRLGPLEWAWRSLSAGQPVPMVRRPV